VDPQRLTQKSQEALQEAQTVAVRSRHTEVGGEHLLLALLDQPEGLVPRLLTQSGADPARLHANVEADLARRPRVTGPWAAPGQVFLTQRLSRLLDRAEREAQRLKDEYVSVEHLVIALLEEGTETPAFHDLRARLAERQITLKLTDARRLIAEQGLDPVFGARPLRRFIGHEVETRIARMLVGGEVEDGTTLRVDARGGQLEVSAENPPRPAEAA
jgi:ATP-dependent Clp protease ATP-binding subunit ClpA